MNELVPQPRPVAENPIAEIPKAEVASVAKLDADKARAEAESRRAQVTLVAEVEKELLRCDRWARSVETMQAAIARAEPVVAGLEPLRRWLATARRRAKRNEVGKVVGVLVSCFPAAGRDLDVFGPTLCVDIMGERPTIWALDAGCRYLRRTSKFMPVISEVLEALEDAEERLAQIAGPVDRLPERLAEAKAALLVKIEEARLREEKICELVAFWELTKFRYDNETPWGYSWDVVNEAKRRFRWSAEDYLEYAEEWMAEAASVETTRKRWLSAEENDLQKCAGLSEEHRARLQTLYTETKVRLGWRREE